jgi:hypothetical protein
VATLTECATQPTLCDRMANRFRLGVLLATLLVALMAAPLAPAATMTLQSVTVDRSSMVSAAQWTAPEGGGPVAWNAPDDTSTYAFPVPASIPAAGVAFTITVTAQARKNGFDQHTRWAPAMGVRGDIVSPAGRVDVSADANSETKPDDSRSATVTLTPRTGSSVVIVGIQDGPTYTYTFQGTADPPPPAPRPGSLPFAQATDATVTAAQAFVLPPAGRCVSRRNFVIRLRRPPKVRFLVARVRVNGRPTRVFIKRERYLAVKGKVLAQPRLAARVDLRRLPAGRFAVRIEALTGSFRTIRGTRQYKTCARKEVGRRPGL